MSVKTKLNLWDPATSSYEYVAGVDVLGLPGVKGSYQEIIEQGGDGAVTNRSTGITRLTGFDVKLYWATEDGSHDSNHAHDKLLRASESHELQKARIDFPDGWEWEIETHIEEFSGGVVKEGHNEATAKFLPSGKINRNM